MTFIAFCGDRAPHFTTIARFVRTLGEDIARVFAAVLAVCDQQGLIGREMFGIDGVKLPSNAGDPGTHSGEHEIDNGSDLLFRSMEAAYYTGLWKRLTIPIDGSGPTLSTAYPRSK